MEKIGDWSTAQLLRFITQRIPSSSFPKPKSFNLETLSVKDLNVSGSIKHNTASQLSNQEAWHVVGATGEPAFTNAWVNFGAPHAVAAFYKDAFGVVHLKGLVKNGTAATSIFTLPVGYRPTETRIFAVIDGVNAVSRLDIAAAGTVVPTTGNNAYISLNVSFRSS